MPTGAGAYAIVLIAGALLALAFPEPDIAPLAWLALVPLLFLARDARMRRGFGLGFVFGLGFFGVLIFWISVVGYVAWVLLIVLQSLFVGLFGALWAWLSRSGSVWGRVLFAASAWISIEALRASVPLGGFTWGQLAQSQHSLPLWTLRPAAWGGAWLVAGLLAAVNALGAEALEGGRRKRLAAAAAALVLLGLPLLLPVTATDGPVLRVAIVQGDVPQDFQGSFYDKEMAITRSHARLTKELDGSELDLVVWPESSVGVDLERDAAAADEVREAARAVGVPMIVGGNLDIDNDRYKVVAFHVSAEGRVVDVYQKTHLVPFGEYVPGRNFLDWIPMLDQVPRDAVAGSEPKVFELPSASVATVISFEGDFGPLVRNAVDAGGDVLVVATNTSTWGETWASAQHVAFSKVRAVENGVGVAHGALSGISAFIDPHGRVMDSTELYEPATMTGSLPVGGATTFYTRTGEWAAYLALVGTLVGVALRFRSRRVDATVAP
ncbi:MAG: apolipoprotein N-acyltransferase [Actinomycetota bacterium]